MNFNEFQQLNDIEEIKRVLKSKIDSIQSKEIAANIFGFLSDDDLTTLISSANGVFIKSKHKKFDLFVQRIKAEYRYSLAHKISEWFNSEKRKSCSINNYIGKDGLKIAAKELLNLSEDEYKFCRDFKDQSFGRCEMLLSILFGYIDKNIKEGDYIDNQTNRPVEVKALKKYNDGAGLGRSYSRFTTESGEHPYQTIQDNDEAWQLHKKGKPYDGTSFSKHKEAQANLMRLILNHHDLVFVVGDDIIKFSDGDSLTKDNFEAWIEYDKGYNVKIWLKTS